MLLQRHPVPITFLVFFVSFTSSTVCFYPDGSNSSESPCPDPVSMSCCPSGSSCLTNGLCWDDRNFMFRGSCRDKSWTNPNCPRYCREFIPWSGKVLAPCNDKGLFTCNYNCTKSNITVPRGGLVLRAYQVPVSFLSSTSISSTFSSSSTFKTPLISTPTATTPLNLVPNGNCTNDLADHSPTNRSPNLAAVTVGVAVPLAIGWFVTLVFFYLHRRKMRLLEQEKSQGRRDYQHATSGGDPHAFGVGRPELPEDQKRTELAVLSSAQEMQG